jgi:hypothetical protein
MAGALWLCSFVLLPFFTRAKRARALLFFIPVLIACALTVGLSGCGGGQSSGPGTTVPTAVAPGSYSIHVSATQGSVSATQTLSLTVQ